MTTASYYSTKKRNMQGIFDISLKSVEISIIIVYNSKSSHQKGSIMKTKTELMYAKASPWRLFFIVALPGMISMFAMSIYSILEGTFIGQVLGEGAFAAVNIAFPLVQTEVPAPGSPHR